jgi:hypothetical protein
MKKYKKFHFCDGRCWRNVSPAPPVNFCDSGEMDAMQIAKLVMQIHANNVLNIDSIKNQIFLMGGAGETRVGEPAWQTMRQLPLPVGTFKLSVFLLLC